MNANRNKPYIQFSIANKSWLGPFTVFIIYFHYSLQRKLQHLSVVLSLHTDELSQHDRTILWQRFYFDPQNTRRLCLLFRWSSTQKQVWSIELEQKILIIVIFSLENSICWPSISNVYEVNNVCHSAFSNEPLISWW